MSLNKSKETKHESIQNVRDLSESEETVTQSGEKQSGKNVGAFHKDEDGDWDKVDNFSTKDILCFAWQIAKGMVRTETTKRFSC